MVDFGLDATIRLEYALSRILYRSFGEDFELANRSPLQPYKPFAEGWAEKRLVEPATYWRQGVPNGLIDTSVEALIVRDQDGVSRPLSYGAFESGYRKV